MPTHYAIDENIQQYTVAFSNTKVASLTFSKPFTIVPSIQVTLDAIGNNPAFKTNVTITGCIIQFAQKWTGNVDVLVIARQ